MQRRLGGSFVVQWLALALFAVVGCGSSDGDGRSRDRANPGSTSGYRTGNAGAAGNAGAPGGTGLTGTSYVTGTGGRIGAEVGGSGPINSGAGGEARLGGTSGEGGNGGQNGSNAGAGGTDQARTDASAAGTAGEAGVCRGAAVHYCNDGNACTLDTCEPATGCQHVAVADGAACDDHDACTQGDHCVAGGCLGTAMGKPAAVLGSLDTFGGFEELETTYTTFQGLATVLTEGLAVFAEPRDPGTMLQLVQIDGTEVKLLDSVFTYGVVQGVQGTNQWAPTLVTHLVALSSNRVAWVASGHDIEIYDVVDGRLVLQAYRYLSEDSLSRVDDAAGIGNHLWLLSTSSSYGFDIGLGGEVAPIGRVDSSVFATASQFTLSEDGNTLYVGGQLGVVRVDVTDPLNPIIDSSPIIARVTERRAYQLEAVGKYLLLQEEVFLATPGDVRLFRTSDWQEIARFSASSLTDVAYTAPTGATFVDGGILLQRIQNSDALPSKLTAELYGLDDAGAHLKDQYVYRDLAAVDNRLIWQPLSPVARGNTAIVGPTRRVLTTSGGVIRELGGVAQGSPLRVLSAGPGRVMAFSSESTHWVDISEPEAPRIRAGGLLGQDATSLIRMSLPNSTQGEVSLLNVEPRLSELRLRWPRSGGEVTQFTLEGTGAPEAVGRFTLPGGQAHAASGDLLLRVMAAEDGTWQLDTFMLPRIPGRGETLLPSETQTLAASTGPVTGAVVRVFADVPSQNLVLVIQPLSAPTTLDWFTRDSGAWKRAGTLTYPESVPRDVVLRGNVAVVAGPESKFGGEGERIDVVWLQAGQVQVHATRELAPSETLADTRLLDIDGDKVYAALTERNGDDPVSRVVIGALSLDTLDTVATYDTPQYPSSMAVVDNHLVFGAKTHLLVADPTCASGKP